MAEQRHSERRRRIHSYAENLRVFRPDLRDHFMCPTCLKEIPLNSQGEISKAHIVPKAAKGRLTTFLCRTCNSYFGRYQDKWLGEYLRLHGLTATEKVRAAKKYSRFIIDEFQVEGWWEIGPKDNEILLYIDTLRNPPDIVAALKRRARVPHSSTRIGLRCQIDDNRHFVSVGFLTAAYLMWFSRLGYSWVLQTHLDGFREALLNPKKKITVPYCGAAPPADSELCIGIVHFDGHYLPAARIADTIVLFPSRQAQGVLHRYPIGASIQFEGAYDLEPDFTRHPGYMTGICVDDYLSVAPDRMLQSDHHSAKSFIIHIDSQRKTVQTLVPVQDDEWKRLSAEANVINATIKLRGSVGLPIVPADEANRST